jgi:hypothetical protein
MLTLCWQALQRPVKHTTIGWSSPTGFGMVRPLWVKEFTR